MTENRADFTIQIIQPYSFRFHTQRVKWDPYKRDFWTFNIDNVWDPSSTSPTRTCRFCDTTFLDKQLFLMFDLEGKISLNTNINTKWVRFNITRSVKWYKSIATRIWQMTWIITTIQSVHLNVSSMGQKFWWKFNAYNGPFKVDF